MNDENQYSSESVNESSTNIANEVSESYGKKSEKSYYSENTNGNSNSDDLEKYKIGKPVRTIIKARLIND